MCRFFLSTVILCAFLCACSSNVPTAVPQNSAGAEEGLSGRERLLSDSLNVRGLHRTYPVPNVVYTPAPKGYKPVYLSSYARHGSRKLNGASCSQSALEVMERAAQLGCLTSLGEDVLAKIRLIEEDRAVSNGDLCSAGVEQHKGIAERMYFNYKNVFSHKGTPVRLYSTVSQRTMMSMFSQNARLLELNPNIVSSCRASGEFAFLRNYSKSERPRTRRNLMASIMDEWFDAGPVLSRLFTPDMPALEDSSSFIINLCSCGTITCGLDLEDVDFLWDVFTYDEMYIIQQVENYNFYVHWSNSPEVGDYVLPSMSLLLKDFIDRADAALLEDIPGADLRFGHDNYIVALYALIGLNGYVPKEEDPLKVIDIFQVFTVAPMAGNFQMVFYRNREGDVIVKLLQNEVEAFLPLETDILPYYHWDDLRAYFESLIDPECLK